ncbi:MAG: tyrosine--tRNA ligase [Candidatus Sericytochromatia bacterium]|nr:tyrosine--tRNA ligase [Candidatus Sericytochromatia bacterium]
MSSQEELLAGAVEAFPEGRLEQLLALGRPLRVKLGFDPTKPDLHLGHSVVLEGLRRFQQAGHQVVLIIGDFTARIGDPTGKEVARPPLTQAEVEAHARTYLEQLGLMIDLERAEIHHNSRWLETMDLTAVLRLLGQATVAQMLARDNFSRRYERGDAIGLHELLYPLLQGQDSVEIRADVELGGDDQRFNLLVGRDLQAAAGQSPQACVTYGLLVGTDGREKMSKSLGNDIPLTCPPGEMYGRVMSVPDSALPEWWRLASARPLAEVAEVRRTLEDGSLHPRDAKMRLGRAIVERFHGPEAAEEAEAAFVRRFQERALPLDIPAVLEWPAELPLAALLVHLGLAGTTSDARRLVAQGGVRMHLPSGQVEVLADPGSPPGPGAPGSVIQVGKRRFVRLGLPERV